MCASTTDATFYGVMIGVGETYLPAFALAIGLGEVMAGLIASVPLMAGGIIQLISIRPITKGFDKRTWIVLWSGLQALAFIPLILAAWRGSISGPLLLLVSSIYWAGSLASGPAWNMWIETMIPKPIRAGYFAKRTRATQIATLTAFVCAGIYLQYAKQQEFLTNAFAVLFVVGIISRAISVVALARHHDQERPGRPKVALPIANTAQPISGRHLLVFLVLVQAMVQLSGPYFTPYMLKQLELSYLGFTGLVSVAFVAKIISLVGWGALARKKGAPWLLTLGGTLIVPLSAFWIVSPSYYWLVFIQTINGIAWAAYELGFFLMFFEAIPTHQRVRMLSYYNMANTTAWCIGSTMGAIILRSLGTDLAAYHTLFVLSAVGRIFAVAYLYYHRPSVPVKVVRVGLRVLGLRPSAAPIETPILPSLADDEVTADLRGPEVEA